MKCSNLLSLVAALICSLPAAIYCASTCPPDDVQCRVQTGQKATRSPPSSSWSPSSRLPPLPTTLETLGVDVADLTDLPGLDGSGKYSSEVGANVTRSRAPLAAGHPCTSNLECDSNQSCELLFSTTSPVPKQFPPVTATSSSSFTAAALIRRSIDAHPPEPDQSPDQKVCSRVDCESTCESLSGGTSSLECPSDSYLDERYSDDQKCCIQTCKCLPEVCRQPKNNCTGPYKLFSRGDILKPGNCCDQFKCLDDSDETPDGPVRPIEPRTQCEHNGIKYPLGITWLTSDCVKCHCTEGVAVCGMDNSGIDCPLPHACSPDDNSTIKLAPNQCCPRCKECNYNQVFYPHLATWKDDFDCKSCSCTDNRVKCHSELCRPVECPENQVLAKVEGICCHQCQCPPGCAQNVDTGRCECANGLGPLPESTLGAITSVTTDGGSKQLRTGCAQDDLDCQSSRSDSGPSDGRTAGTSSSSWLIILSIATILAGLTLVVVYLVCYNTRRARTSRGGGGGTNGVLVQGNVEYHAVKQAPPSDNHTADPSLIKTTTTTTNKLRTNVPDEVRGAQGHNITTANGHVRPQSNDHDEDDDDDQLEEDDYQTCQTALNFNSNNKQEISEV